MQKCFVQGHVFVVALCRDYVLLNVFIRTWKAPCRLLPFPLLYSRLCSLRILFFLCQFTAFRTSVARLHESRDILRQQRPFEPFRWTHKYLFIRPTRCKMRFLSPLSHRNSRWPLSININVDELQIYGDVHVNHTVCDGGRALLREQKFLMLINHVSYAMLIQSSSRWHNGFQSRVEYQPEMTRQHRWCGLLTVKRRSNVSIQLWWA